MSLKPKEVVLNDGVTYAPAVVSVGLDGLPVSGSGGTTTVTRYNMEVTGYTTQNNPTQIIYRNPATLAEVYRENFTYDGSGRLLTKTVVVV